MSDARRWSRLLVGVMVELDADVGRRKPRPEMVVVDWDRGGHDGREIVEFVVGRSD